ncbi:conserved hypothetical protein [Aspergillus terreus NIH2624]|uniref:Exo-1,4-beta-D-glucosaminidase n=1 Tax=Aspergillus terreus (strain NIH 2624 / FGSC A1156) TaxID=341663 RepID=Q0CG53_ASPTN|nr:uncharacterized protein ATEG_07339 [Aspergillus terreus NIH2624]EAU32723.1 conserved hypothetical protein [Aspergillus terreus NIH2624]
MAVDQSVFQTAWLYREEFKFQRPSSDEHVFLITHGITSKADIFFNGVQIASQSFQHGSYGGRRYEITEFIRQGSNALLVKAYPTNYLRDFALGFVDWNPYPPDNGTGVWRDVEVKRTGPISMSPTRVRTDFSDRKTQQTAIVTVLTDLENHTNLTIEGILQGRIQSDDSSQTVDLFEPFRIAAHGMKTVSIKAKIVNPRIWWPAAWGKQPLYSVALNVSLGRDGVSDIGAKQHFGIRKVTSELNPYNDIVFSINGYRFLVKGAGYSPDMFLRFDQGRVEKIFQYMLDMGLNTVRLEGKQEHPELYDLADRMGLMVLAGWECCDKWEGWEYNHDAAGEKWTEKDYQIAQVSMLHEAEMMQAHASMLGFLVGSDFWPDDRATAIYLSALERMDWLNPVIASASKRGYPKQLGPSGMKMDGPYDWVPPNYWYGDRLGAAFGFGSELGAGCGTPQMESLRRFLSPDDMETLWKRPDDGMFHMSRNDSEFYNRSIYNKALFARYGAPNGLEDYVLKAQLMDYEATRAQFEALTIRQTATRPATGSIYWMLNSAWPNLHWQLFDYYLRPAGAYFGTKIAARSEHVAYDYESRQVHLINQSLRKTGRRVISVDLIDKNGTWLSHQTFTTEANPNSSKGVLKVTRLGQIRDVGFLRLLLEDPVQKTVLSRNVYWVSPVNDELDWESSNWYTTPVTQYANYSVLGHLPPASVTCDVRRVSPVEESMRMEIILENLSTVPAFFIRLKAVDPRTHEEVLPVFWSDNYVSLFPRETVRLIVTAPVTDWMIEVSGGNVKQTVIGAN